MPSWITNLATKLITAIAGLGAIALAFFAASKSGESKGKAKEQLKQHKANEEAEREARIIHEENINLSDDDLADKL